MADVFMPVEIEVELEAQSEFEVDSQEEVRFSMSTQDDYEKLKNKPAINDVELLGNKSFDELGITELINKIVTNNKITKVSELINDEKFVSEATMDAHTDNPDIHITSGERDAWNNKADKADTLAGYGITDCMTNEQIVRAINEAVGSVDLSGYLLKTDLTRITNEEIDDILIGKE